jgi:uncharacterized protein YyaL (SSP411 family)
MRQLFLSMVIGFACVTPSIGQEALKPVKTGGIQWVTWSDAAFQKAKKEHKPIILDLEAVWCHWCHVMDERTYSNPAVANLIKNGLVALRVDQDSRPDLSIRYQDYGWPATILFSPSGKEIIKHAGFIEPREMISILKSVIKDPDQVRSSAMQQEKVKYSASTSLPKPLQNELLEKCVDGYDNKNGGWGSGHKFLDWDTVEFCMTRAHGGDAKFAGMAKSTLNGELKLVDPVWGGVYQYSTDGDWVHPHFERIMQMQGENMRMFSLGYSLWNEPKYIQAAKSIQRFLQSFMFSPEGAFYTSMDADLVPGKHSADYFKLGDEQRRKLGIPRIDKHIYARENGWVINGLTALYGATGDNAYLDQAVKAANWIVANRSLPGGGFQHDEKDLAGPYLDDTLAMGRAFISLYGVTGDRRWLERAQRAADFIDKQFKLTHVDNEVVQSAGYATAAVTASHTVPTPTASVDENVMVARFANLLYQYSGRKSDNQISQTAMRYLATPAVARDCGMYTGGILLANQELSSAPAHITVVGAKDDPQAKALVLAAQKYPSGYRIVEWWDRREGPLPHMDVEFPQLAKAAAFGCANERCSAPVYAPDRLNATIDGLQ